MGKLNSGRRPSMTDSGNASISVRVVAVRPSEVHVWWLNDSGPGDVLGPEEIEHVARLRDERERRRFAARRSGLRRILGLYAGVDPTALVVDRSCQYCGDLRHGRPRLVGDADVSFSTASRPGCFVVAIATAAMSVGVDIESTHRFELAAAADVWRVALTAAERKRVEPGDVRGITRLWCRKEAALKAMGLGIGGRSPDTVDMRGDAVEGWQIGDLPRADPWAGAVAARSPIDWVLTIPNTGLADLWSERIADLAVESLAQPFDLGHH